MIRVLLDQGLPRSTVELLRADGWDAVHVFDCGLSTAPDEQILAFARAHAYVVCTEMRISIRYSAFPGRLVPQSCECAERAFAAQRWPRC